MHILSSAVFTIAMTLGLVSAGYHQGGSSYSVVTKHEVPHYGGKYLGDYGSYGYGKIEGHEHIQHEPFHYPKYAFDYGVKDSHTGDQKNQWEHRDGDKVKGGYSLKESDGTTRVVEYTADDHNGFNAVVKKIGHAHHPQVYQKSSGHYGGSHGAYGAGYGYDQDHHSHGHASSYVNLHQLH